ncbi:MAG: hypothetical protein PHO32_07025, partial [Candidatus Cloacimonetes bacterium]|nr:hypothetical protein [Candidatus Cloacimonadota bacterium]
ENKEINAITLIKDLICCDRNRTILYYFAITIAKLLVLAVFKPMFCKVQTCPEHRIYSVGTANFSWH